MKNKKAKYSSIAATMFFASLVMSCSSDALEAVGGNSNDNGNPSAEQVEGALCIMPQYEIVDINGDNTRATMYAYNNDLKSRWDEHDILTVFASSDQQTRAEYTMAYMSADGSHAGFDGGPFKLKAGETYISLDKPENALPDPDNSKISNKNNITLSYEGQRQVENGNDYLLKDDVARTVAHLGPYDYLAAAGVCGEDDHVGFDFKRIGMTMRLNITGLTAGHKFRELVVYDSEDSYRQPLRRLNLEEGFGPTTSEYSPFLQEPDNSTTEYKNSPRLHVALGPDTNSDGILTNDEGITVPNENGTGKGSITAYISLPPHDFTGKTIVFSLTPGYRQTHNAYYCTLSGRPLVAGKAYRLSKEGIEATQFNVTLKLNHKWQHGASKQVTRATTGDPGVDDDLILPKYVYYILCIGGTVRAVNALEGPAVPRLVNSISVNGKSGEDYTTADPDDKWDTPEDKLMSTYGKKLTFTVETEADKAATKNLYVVASTEDLSSSFTSISNGTSTEEEDVQNLIYSIQGSTDVKKQEFLHSLYSTPYTTVAYVGELKDPYQDVVLYHTAAKFDLQWNGTMMTEGSDNVGVQGVQDAGLSLFKPTQNGASPFVSSSGTTYSVKTPITEGTKYQGRTVYYLPQMQPSACTYNIYIGGNGSTRNEDIRFTPNVDGGFTSWLRGQVVGMTP